MASKASFRRDSKGIREILNSDAGAAVVTEAAEQVAALVRASVGDEIVVEVNPYTSRDRRAAGVAIRDSRGVEVQASTGALTRAAAAVGLEVKPK